MAFGTKYAWLRDLHRNLYVLLVWRYLVLMFLFMLCRLAFYLINTGYFPNTGFGGLMRIMGGGLQFDTAAILYTNLLYALLFLLPFNYRYNLLFQRSMKGLFLVTNGVALLANCCDFIYFQFGFRRTTASIFREFSHEDNLGSLLPKFIVGYWYVVLIWLGLMAILFLSYGRLHLKKPETAESKVARSVLMFWQVLALMVASVFFLSGIRGDLRPNSRPISLSTAGKYIREPLEANIVLNTPFSIYRTIGRQSFDEESFFKSEEELARWYDPVHQPAVRGEMRKDNVVVIILESFGCEYLRIFNRDLENGTYRGYAPFLDSLASQGLIFTHSFSNGRKSIDAMPSVLASIPMMVEPYVLTPYASNRINGLASILGAEGYQTAFFHGAPNGSMGLDVFAKTAGFSRYFGMNEYPGKDDFDGSWGIWDEEFLQFYARTMNGFSEPFMTSVFTVSSHHPFEVPARYKGRFRKGTQPIHQCVMYTDHALQEFFRTASKMPWYKNTLFVITGDHTSQSSYLQYKTNLGAFRVPVIFFKPDGSLKGVVDGLAQQIDILPTVLGYLNYGKPFVAFGQNLLDPSGERMAVTYTAGTYQLVSGDYLFLFNGLMRTGFYLYKTDILLSKNLAGHYPEIELRMESKVKAFIQQYNNRIIQNRLTINPIP